MGAGEAGEVDVAAVGGVLLLVFDFRLPALFSEAVGGEEDEADEEDEGDADGEVSDGADGVRDADAAFLPYLRTGGNRCC